MLVLVLSGCASTPRKYIKSIEESKLFSNTIDSALPQTEVYNIVKAHFADTSTDKTKKVVLLGIDGARADVLLNLSDNSNLFSIGGQGESVLSYSGGVNNGDQATSTAPSWVSIFTGQWADVT